MVNMNTSSAVYIPKAFTKEEVKAFTVQDIFDRCAIHLFKQGIQSMGNPDDTGELLDCKYRGEEGRMCSIGIFIPDSVYTKKMDEGMSVPILLALNSFMRETLSFCDPVLVYLQRIHDRDISWGSTESMKSAFRLIAEKFNLNTEVLETLSFSDR